MGDHVLLLGSTEPDPVRQKGSLSGESTPRNPEAFGCVLCLYVTNGV